MEDTRNAEQLRIDLTLPVERIVAQVAVEAFIARPYDYTPAMHLVVRANAVNQGVSDHFLRLLDASRP